MVRLVGILNVTPDSFSDGGNYFDAASAVAHAELLFAQGAAIVDVGAESTRPNADQLSDDEEWQRLAPIMAELISKYPDRLSLDSYHPVTMRRAMAMGKLIMNDVTGFHDQSMRDIAIQYDALVIVSHLPGNNIARAHLDVPVSTVDEVKDDLLRTARALEASGLARHNIILDPGIGFGKTADLNWELLKFAAVVPEYAAMIGYSRKRFLGDDRMSLAPNIEAGRLAIAAGAAYLRVHDVAGHASLIDEVS